MAVKAILKKIFRRLIWPDAYSEQRYISQLRNKYGISIGEGTRVFEPHTQAIDITRPHMLEIGKYVKIARNVTVLCHDYSRSVCIGISGMGNAGESRMTHIGDNVFIGMNATILMGTHIGNNSIVGAGSVVSGNFPDGVVIAGNPARVICTIEDFYEKRKSRECTAAKEYVAMWNKRNGRMPCLEEMTDAFSWLYLPHTEEMLSKYPGIFHYGGVDEQIMRENFLTSKPLYQSFEDFLKDCDGYDCV